MSQASRVSSRGDRGFVLIEILVVLVVLVALAAIYFGVRKKPGEVKPAFEGEAQTTLGKSLQKAEGVGCQTNLSQLRQMLQMEWTTNSQDPAALNSSGGVPLKCPVSGYDYHYDPQSGRVWCVTPGHEKY